MPLKSEIHIESACFHGGTYLKTGFAQPPFKIMDITEDRITGHLQLMIMSSSPGILDGDHYCFQVDVADNSRLELKTQSYQRLFQMESGATQCMNVQVGKDALLMYLPHPLVPHAGSIFRSVNTIRLSHGASLIWGEVMSCGRQLNGEKFGFTTYHSLTEIYKCNRLVVKENLFIRPSEHHPDAIGKWEGFTHQAGFIFIHDEVDMKQLLEDISEHLSAFSNIEYGLTCLASNGLMVRVLGFKAEQLFLLLQQICSYCKSALASHSLKPALNVI